MKRGNKKVFKAIGKVLGWMLLLVSGALVLIAQVLLGHKRIIR